MGAAFDVPAYRRYWASQLVSGVGTWAQGSGHVASTPADPETVPGGAGKSQTGE